MLQTIRVATAADDDPIGRDVLAEVHRALGLTTVSGIRTAKVYRIEGVTAEQASRLAAELLADPVVERWTLNSPLLTDADCCAEVGYRPGVMNPEAASIAKAAADLGIEVVAVDSSREYAFRGRLSDEELDLILRRLLVNPTVERRIEREPDTLRITGTAGATTRIALAAMTDVELLELSNRGLYLDLTEMHVIRDHFAALAREPTDLELEVLAQTWSEHCVHKTFKSSITVNGTRRTPFMTRLKETAQDYPALVVSAFEDNSGVMEFYEGWAIAGKVETHNSPSAIEPYGGAATGSGGVFRDIMGTGQGAAVVASTDMFCFAPPDLPQEHVPPGALPPDYLLRRVVAGVRDYGNRMGIPTNNGSVHFHADFRAKPTVIVGAYGLVPLERARKGQPAAGDRILVLGGRTGRDGIHGATFSSTAMTHETVSVNAQAVQIGNPIEEKRMLDAILVCRDHGLIRAITDCGAGGFSSAIGEMGKRLGAEVHLERAPLKYAGLAPWEIFVSESQERMVLAVAPENVAAVERICSVYNVEVTDLGSFEPTGRLVVYYGDELVGDLEMDFLHEGWPRRSLVGEWSAPTIPASLPEPPATEAAWQQVCRRILAHPTIASKEAIVRQYDHSVQGTSAGPPFGGPRGQAANDAAILAPLLGKPYGIVIAHGLNPVLNCLDPYWGGIWAAAEAMANYVAVGGDLHQACLIDNFIWPAPDAPSLGALDRAVDACVAVMQAFERPFISGKDSLSSTYRYPDGQVLKIPPVLCISVFGRIPDVGRTTSSRLQRPRSVLVLLGELDTQGMAGSIYLELAGGGGQRPPHVDLTAARRTMERLHEAIAHGQVRACHDVSEGGLFVAVAEMAMGSGLGAEIDVAPLAARADCALFNETAGCFVVEVDEPAEAEKLFASVPHRVIGRTLAVPQLRLRSAGEELAVLPLADLVATWQAPLRVVFH